MRISASLLPPTISQWQKSPHVFDAFIKGLEKKIKVLAKASTRIIPFPKLCQLTSALCFHGDHCYIQHKNYAKAHNCHLWQVFSRLHRSSSSTSQKVTTKYSQISNYQKNSHRTIIFQGFPYLCGVQLEGPGVLPGRCGVQLDINHLAIILDVNLFCQRHSLLWTGASIHADVLFGFFKYYEQKISIS